MPHVVLNYAREMRRAPTPPERLLWQALRRGQFAGLKFRRQAVMGRYIADFYCPTIRLLVEVDGETHADPAGDAERDAWMARENIRVLRFWNNEVMTNLPGVLEVIAEAARGRG